ncbi:MAG: Zn-ribbon domain-containing OB-fold protein [Armatimonadota bacterium]|nr:Zn-ribbon domain-containing OB-fold protein [Armatimonadota bacterium]MDR7450370.1 Zn-ribbon domain-containing OB-fold protein [Armatimonadota bacterium]MDR7467047.1 Zn-ribbon domain-containing OB-fold protein [Armatimonadota bacterium]MDR7493411.1 Zn-ribbon domain-containing OB-fold protein [Armatimonadota bacterium]MDR7498676.1 Zn-ribbon domain-containing OB-fold protein [Armatimonadota bacterium]
MRPTERRTWYGTMPVQFRYTPGVAGRRFFETLRRTGRLAVTHCAECRRTYLPPRLYCEECFADLSAAWSEVEPRGRVHTYTVVHRDREGRPLREPEVVAYVRIDGTDGGLVTRLRRIAPADVRIDLPVEGVLVPRRQRTGSLEDLLGFAPVGSAGSPTAARPTAASNPSRPRRSRQPRTSTGA